jgi:prevent-host-death family protein
MQAVTIREAKARLNALVEAAQRGEQIVLMRGATHVAAIVPLSADDLEIAPRLTDAQAERLWRQLAAERAAGTTVVQADAEAAVAFLRSPRARSTPRRRSAGRAARKR